MSYIVEFGPDTNPERFETMTEIEVWLDEYIINHLQHDEDFEIEKQKFIDTHMDVMSVTSATKQ